MGRHVRPAACSWSSRGSGRTLGRRRVHTVVREDAARSVVRMMVSSLADGASVLEPAT
jgi:hypothetical protein